MKILVSNVGSTSLKFKLYEMPQETLLCTARAERIGSDTAAYAYKNEVTGRTHTETAVSIRSYTDGIRKFMTDAADDKQGVLSEVSEICGIGFKTILAKDHSGVYALTEEVLEAMRKVLFIAPAHNGPYLAAIGEFDGLLPNAEKVGVFETAYHATIPLRHRMFGIPYEWYERYGLMRMGYHGASFTYLSQQAYQNGKYPRIIGCHLGGSCSVCAILDGKSFDDSFGMSLQTGLLHANRCGDTDAYIFPFLENEGLTQKEIMDGLSKRGGLLGISGVSNDLRDIEAAATDGNERAKLAIDVFVTGILRYIGAFYAELGGLDKLVFTGGIGEHSATIRSRVCHALQHLGILLDDEKNNNLQGEGSISTEDSPVLIEVITANEELGVARKTYERIVTGKDLTVENELS